MVVHKLFGYMYYNIHTSSQLVSLEELAKEHKRRYNCNSPILVMDGKIASLHIISKDYNRKKHEMQFNDYVNIATSFVEKMKAINIRPVFYFGKGFGFNVDYRQRNLPITYGKESIQKMFDSIRETGYSHQVGLPPGVPAFFPYILKYGCNCTVYFTKPEVPIYKEIARYARDTPDCFGILAGDSNYLIPDTKPLLSTFDFDFDRLKAQIFRHKDLVKVSGLESEALPLLACLAGNNVITHEELEKFHRRLSPGFGSHDNQIIDKVITYIQKQCWNWRREIIPEIAQDIGITEELLSEGIRFYTIKSNSDDDVTDDSSGTVTALQEKYLNGQAPLTLYKLLIFRKYEQGLTMEDPIDTDMPPSALIYRPVRQRIYYILFDREPVDIEEWCVCRNIDPIDAETVKTVEFETNVFIPSMCDLLSGNVDINVRWEIFRACLGISIPAKNLRVIPRRFVALCSLLNFLLHCEGMKLEQQEVEAFICQALLVHTAEFIESQEVDSRAVSLVGIFWRGIGTILNVVSVCGYPFPYEDIMPWNYFDGRVFYKCYNSKRNSLETVDLLEGDSEDIELFQFLFRNAVTGTKFSEANC